MTVPDSLPPDTHVRVPLSAEQLTWVAEQARARNVSRQALLRYLVQRFKTADERMGQQHAEPNSPDTEVADSAGDSVDDSNFSDEETAASMFDFSNADDETPPSMFDYLNEED